MPTRTCLEKLLHGEAAYIHELRFQMEEQERGTGSWRTPSVRQTERESLPNPRTGARGTVHEL